MLIEEIISEGEFVNSVEDVKDPIYTDSAKGAIEMLGTDSSWDVSKAKAQADPEVEGVWLVTNIFDKHDRNKGRAIVYLAGYKDPYGRIRAYNDFEDEEFFDEAKQVWGRSGGKLKRKFRCMSGHRKGRVVANAAQCFQPIDIQKRLTLRKTKARMGPRLARKSRRTKKFNPISRRLQSLNKRR